MAPEKTLGLRLKLSSLYFQLKEHSYRAIARDHLEFYMSRTPDPSADVVRFLLSNVYLAIGPAQKAVDLFEAHGHRLSEETHAVIGARVQALTGYARDVAAASGAKKTSKMIEAIDAFDDIDMIIDKYLLADNPRRSILESEKIFTFGSCFARNVARVLAAKHFDVDSFWVGEEVNTSFSNFNLMKMILGHETPHPEYYKAVLEGLDIARLRECLKNSGVVIYTLGLGSAFFSKEGDYVPHRAGNYRSLSKSQEVDYRFSTVDENVRSLNDILAMVRSETKAKTFVVTVSPVPLAVSVGQNSPICADAEGKAILRAAAGQFARAHPETVIYYPSFEFFRWMPCFTRQRAFGDDDGAVRHPNSVMVEKIIETFVDRYR